MKVKSKIKALLCVSLILIWPGVGVAGEMNFKVDPVTNDGKKWRVGYYEGGAYINYQMQLTETSIRKHRRQGDHLF